jgi:hypothetical protein
MYGGRRGTYSVLCGNLRERDPLQDIGVDGKIILTLIFKKWVGDTDWIDLAQDRDRWRALVREVMHFRVP